MLLENLFNMIPDTVNVILYDDYDGARLAVYDGRNSIDPRYNTWAVKELYTHNGFLVVIVTDFITIQEG